MPFIKYRKPADAIHGKNRYGYYEHLEYINQKRNELMVIDTKQDGQTVWPVYVSIKMPIHNPEELQAITDIAISMFDMLRGEHGENEKNSPSDIKHGFNLIGF